MPPIIGPSPLHQRASSSLGLAKDTYIYQLVPSVRALAAISSDDSLRLFDPHTLQLLPGGLLNRVNIGVTCLSRASASGDILATAGRDGLAVTWDTRSGEKVSRFSPKNNAPVTALASNHESHRLATGTELVHSQAAVTIWDDRQPKQPLLQYVESHNDDVTELQFHPSDSKQLLSGGTDGLVNIYDITIADEDDALLQVINHGSVHHAGFLSADAIYALSHDEVFSIHPKNTPEDEAVEPSPVLFGDLRPSLACDYVIDIWNGKQGRFAAIGSTTEQHVALVSLLEEPQWHFEKERSWHMPGGHGEEIVRSIFIDEAANTVFTAGEDGLVRVWQPLDEDGARSPRVEKPKKKGGQSRFAPY